MPMLCCFLLKKKKANKTAIYSFDVIRTCHKLNELLHWDTGEKISARFLERGVGGVAQRCAQHTEGVPAAAPVSAEVLATPSFCSRRKVRRPFGASCDAVARGFFCAGKGGSLEL